MRVLFLGLLLCVAAGTAPAQTATPTPPAKINSRPTPTPVPAHPSEPYDNADVATMAARCVILSTGSGDIEMELFPEHAPETVRNFLNLVAIGAFDTTTFSRVVPGFVVQGGNIWTRTGGLSLELAARARRTIPDEPSKILHERGIVSMARPPTPNSATTNFFILVDSDPILDGTFSAFGRVTRGMDVVDAINKAPVTGEKPDKPVLLKTAKITACTPGS